MNEKDPIKKRAADGGESTPRIDPRLPELLLNWYDKNARTLPWRKDRDPYHVWLSEIMLQQTRAEVVKTYYTRFLREIPTLGQLAETDEEKLLKLWEGLGYYSRARNLQKAAKVIVETREGRFPETAHELRKLPGIGPYTAGAIASICFEQKTPAVDGNVLRIISRMTGFGEEDTAKAKKLIARALEEIYPDERSGDFNQSLMELGATVCLPNGRPLCENCPVSDLCTAFRKQEFSFIGKQKKQRRTEHLTVFVLSCGGSIALCRRQGSGLLAGLWELPNVHRTLSETQAAQLAGTWEVKPVSIVRSARRSHVFTHIKWEMVCYYFECAVRNASFVWADRDALAETYALPTAFRVFLKDTGGRFFLEQNPV